jgi:hypothetical protein
MTKGLFLIFSIIAVLWLALWTFLAERGRRGGWAPFDMREPDPPSEAPPSRRGRRPQPVRARRSR